MKKVLTIIEILVMIFALAVTAYYPIIGYHEDLLKNASWMDQFWTVTLGALVIFVIVAFPLINLVLRLLNIKFNKKAIYIAILVISIFDVIMTIDIKLKPLELIVISNLVVTCLSAYNIITCKNK